MVRHRAGPAWPAAAALGVLLDRALGEPPSRVHPVGWFGRAMVLAECADYRDSRSAGTRHAILGVLAGAGAGALLRSAVLSTWLAVAGRSLGEAALTVARALDLGDLETARAALPALVGRDPAGLDEREIARAVVESVAENTVDAVVAPAFWAAVGGAPGALGYRAVNTLDAMVGHRSPRYARFGWAAARLDDVANLVPARVCALLTAAVAPAVGGSPGAALRVWRRDAAAHPSPNAGPVEASAAGALGVTLGGRTGYGHGTEERPRLGDGPAPGPADLRRAARLSRLVGAAAVVLAAALAVVLKAAPAGITRGR
jgi:adenosylcobinamide-phosphate synthase